MPQLLHAPDADADLLVSAQGAAKARAALAVEDAQIEVEAERIYSGWREVCDFKPWVPGGNSVKQDEARQVARRALAAREPSCP